MCLGTLGVSGFLLLLFVLDAALGIPFGGISFLVDILAALGCAAVGYASWETYREFK